MNLTKISKSIKFAVASVAIAASMSAVPVFASDDYGNRQLVPRTDGIPFFFVSEVDYTNNQIEFAYADQYTDGKQIDKVSVGWLKDRTLESYYSDARMYDGTFKPEMQEVYQINGDIDKYYTKTDSWFSYYVVDPEIDLKQNSFNDLFYVVSFKDGDVWADTVSYADCAYGWTEGKSCRNDGFVSVWLQRNVIYTIVDAEKKTPAPKQVVGEPVGDNIETGDVPTGDTTEQIGDGDVVDVTKPDDSETVDIAEPTENLPKNAEIESTEILPKITEVASTVKYLTDSTSGAVKRELADSESDDETDDDELSEGSSDDEIEVVNEGFGDTTLEVPALGATVKENNFNVWPYILLGFAVGMFSSWFLLLVILKKKIQER